MVANTMERFEFITDVMLERFYEFFESVYDVDFSDAQSDEIYRALRAAWESADDSAVPLLAAVFGAVDKLSAAESGERAKLARTAREKMAEQFDKRAANARGRLLDAIYDAVEAQRPGTTGVERTRRVGRPDPRRPVPSAMRKRFKAKPKPQPKPARARRPAAADPEPGPAPTRRPPPRRSAGVLARAIAELPEPAEPTHPPGPVLPAVPNLDYLSPERAAMAMTSYFDDKARALTSSGDMMGAQRAMQDQQQWSAMGVALNRSMHDTTMNIIRNIR